MNYYLLFIGTAVCFLIMLLNERYTRQKTFISVAVFLSTIVPFWFLKSSEHYKSISFMSVFYLLLAASEEKKYLSKRVFHVLLVLSTFLTVLVGLNEIIFDKNRIMTMKIDVYKTLLTTMWLLLSIVLFRTVNFFNGLVPIICFIVSVFSFSIYLNTGFLSKAILTLMNLFIGALFPVIYYNFPPAKINLSQTDATFLGYIFGLFLVYSVNYSIIYTGLIIPVLMLSLPVIFVIFLIIFSYSKKFYIPELSIKKAYKWNITEKSFVIYITITTLYLNIAAYMLYKNESVFLQVIFFFIALFTLFSTGKSIFLKKEPAESNDQIQILGVRIDNVTMRQAVESVEKRVQQGDRFYLATPNSLTVYECRQDLELKEILNESGMNVPDGIGLIWAADFFHTPLQERIPGIDFMMNLCSMAQSREYSIFLLGSKQEIVELTSENLQAKFPGLKVAGTHNGYFSEDESIIEIINDSGANFLFVALGVPRQERWIFKNIDRLKINCAMGVGGSFDVISGALKRAPEIMQTLGLEWFFRVLQEPDRIGRIFNLPKFVREVLIDFIEKQKKT